ncbi:protein translocase subunit SecD [Sodalis endosymbiont of Henestaris halophilus]|uniref:protein translocase subunit SecD n=1 Tax=Sodalis endosymbiont of Henestaris halophilus TaxID=1929246 RepID=UPI000BC00E9A|nr:protein translocase subunit SecD [Sodalis endosymbiont of Henestaris halophilus]SNC58679.1 preprotein translocase subunit SecD [Sodalis endosymbiont of Henestaris halophilus]
MLNHYSLWKYSMLVLTLLVGFMYALPNLYGEDPSLQITSAQDEEVNELTSVQVRTILEQKHIASKSITLMNGIVLARFSNPDLQLLARDNLVKSLGENYVVALNLAPAIPNWLAMLGATPMKLGLDLRGGVHFLIEVDMDTAFNKQQEKIRDTLLSDLREKDISYVMVRKIEGYGNEIRFRDANTRNQAISWLASNHRDLVINSVGNNALSAKLSDDRLCKDREYAVQQNITILRNRINQLGITESLVRRQRANRIVVELPGIQDIKLAKKILGATETLEFRLINILPNQTSVVNGNLPENLEVKTTSDGQPVVLYKQVILTGDHIIHSTCSADEYNRPQVTISLDSSGGNIMSNFTKNNVGKLMATLLVAYKDSGKKDVNGRVILERQEKIINIAMIQSQLGKSFRITGIKNYNEAHQLSLLLRSGALIAPIQILEEHIIGPTLGLKNITQGLQACLWGLMASILFMVVWYRLFGLIATTAIIANLVLIIGIMSLLPGVTLTMSGIAGIVLTLTVAVDANVLINERIKEELRNGRTVQQAIHEGYRGAFSSIVDANVTTLITAAILYAIGTGSLKGFAITTAIGIATSMFTSIIGTRAIVNLLYGSKRINKLSI